MEHPREELAHQDKGGAGAGGARCCLDSPAVAAAEANEADICTIQQIKVRYCHQNGEFLLTARQFSLSGAANSTILAS
jgi:hypothetical protein